MAFSGDIRIDALLSTSSDGDPVRWNNTSSLGTSVDLTYSFSATLPTDYQFWGIADFQPLANAMQQAVRDTHLRQFHNACVSIGIDGKSQVFVNDRFGSFPDVNPHSELGLLSVRKRT